MSQFVDRISHLNRQNFLAMSVIDKASIVQTDEYKYSKAILMENNMTGSRKGLRNDFQNSQIP